MTLPIVNDSVVSRLLATRPEVVLGTAELV